MSEEKKKEECEKLRVRMQKLRFENSQEKNTYSNKRENNGDERITRYDEFAEKKILPHKKKEQIKPKKKKKMIIVLLGLGLS